MKYTRIYSDDGGESWFEVVEVPLHGSGVIGSLSVGINVKLLRFRQNQGDYNWDFHCAPARQFIILLDGEIEIEVSSGGIRRFSGGDILLVEDVFGKGHRTRSLKNQTRSSLFIEL